ncbi:nitrilase-related carbon-nitrogen hydrolase [Engelhardtia mirabilis]|uniref:2-oxoglutaramate amidase n=1 Tax=Engelhardtia mirabilis TaxID=2528011 RepID=A0A518BHS3_9BACT|nr:2-oxoglutaramate amidase [Planctomycetes bacterium Pla133]QDV00855.1 2-oxoglutaramate amidase [Planctomycetes bacterium Pla86]
MRIGAWQFDVRRGELAANLAAGIRGLEAASRAGLELVVLPEMWPTSFLSAGGPAPVEADRSALDAAVRASSESVARLVERAAELGVAVAGSAYGAAPEGGLPRNRFSLWSRGEELSAYDKVHLFSVTGENLGFSAGEQAPAAVALGPATVAGVICYDLRFAPVVEAARRAGADLLLVPAQWPTPRASHWFSLLAGRAVEAQAFVLGANRTGVELMGRRKRALAFGGHSALVGPDGVTLARGTGVGAEELVWAHVDPDQARALRREVRVADDRRPELYTRWQG